MMTITFITNFVNHHQIPVADELYKMSGIRYHYIACKPLSESRIKGGYDPTLDRSYIIRAFEGDKQLETTKKLIDDSDVVIIGSAPNDWVYHRKKENKVTFHLQERWFKHLSLRLLAPNSVFFHLKHFTQFRNKRTYMLCASAYTSKDVKWYGAFPHKCFKWGYFTKVEDWGELSTQSSLETAQIMWCARFLKWKHPELPIQLAYVLKEKGYRFHLDMFGSGEEIKRIEALILRYGVDDCVSLCGNRPNEGILMEMRRHSIFLFTSDRNEGWGAVLNEAMSNGCAVVASDEIGSVPYLIDNGNNGLLFKSGDIVSLSHCVESLLDNEEKCRRIRNNAITTMRDVWSPHNAAISLVKLMESVLSNDLKNYNVYVGPASWAK